MSRLMVGVLVAALLVDLCAGCAATRTAPAAGGEQANLGAVGVVGAPGAVARLLRARSAAVLGHDQAALASTLAPGADGTAAGLATRLAGVGLASWSYQVQSVASGPRPGQVSVRVLLSYRLRADPAASPAATALRLMVLSADPSHAGELVLSADSPVGAWLPWDVAQVVVHAAPGAAVLDVRGGPAGTAVTADTSDTSDTAEADRVLGMAERAAAAVSAVWGTGWRRAPVVVVAGSADELAHMTGRTRSSVAGLVAVTTADRVYVDMPAYLALSAAGQQVLLSHEVTHLATGAAADPEVPQWMKEGFADYVGFLGSGIDLQTAAGGLLSGVQAGRVPPALPADAVFSAGGQATADAYAGAWLACRLLAADRGQAVLVGVYRATSAGRGSPADNVDAALRAVTGQGTAAWTARWRAWLTRLAAQPWPPSAVVAR